MPCERWPQVSWWLRCFRKDRQLLLALLRVSFVSILLLVIGELAGPFVVTVLHLPTQYMPIIFAPAGLGLMLESLLMPSLTRRFGKSRTIALGSLGTAASLILIPLGRSIWSKFALLALGILLFVGAIMFVNGVAREMVNIPALHRDAGANHRGGARSWVFLSIVV